MNDTAPSTEDTGLPPRRSSKNYSAISPEKTPDPKMKQSIANAIEAKKDEKGPSGTTICDDDAMYQPSNNGVNGEARTRAINATPDAKKLAGELEKENQGLAEQISAEKDPEKAKALSAQRVGVEDKKAALQGAAAAAVRKVCRVTP